MTDSTHSAKLDLNANALTVLERRYLVKDDHGTSGGMRWKYLSGPFDDPVNTDGNDAPLNG